MRMRIILRLAYTEKMYALDNGMRLPYVKAKKYGGVAECGTMKLINLQQSIKHDSGLRRPKATQAVAAVPADCVAWPTMLGPGPCLRLYGHHACPGTAAELLTLCE